MTSAPGRAILERDWWRCVRCGVLVIDAPRSAHHLVRGNRADNRPSNLITLCGTGTTGCHGWVTGHPRAARLEGGWVRLRHQPSPELRPVLYRQPGRDGWYLLADDLTLTATEDPCPAR